MRVWVTQEDPLRMVRDLDDNRLIAQHREAVGVLHMVAGKNPQPFSRNPLSTPFQNCNDYLVALHDAVVLEMKFRGWQRGGHATPIDFSKFPNFISKGNLFVPDPNRIEFDRKDLNARWLKQCQELQEGTRKRELRWTHRGYPSWMEPEVLDLLQLRRELATVY